VFGILYFTLTITLVVTSLAFMVAPLIQIIWNIPVVTMGIQRVFLPYPTLILMSAGGLLVLTLTMHLIRGLGSLHGRYAKALLVTE
jgi:putative sensor protein